MRKGVREAFRKHAPTYEEALELVMVLQEEAIYRAAPSRLVRAFVSVCVVSDCRIDPAPIRWDGLTD